MSQASTAEQYMLELINAERAKVGVQPLAFDGDLNESSEDHSNWMLSSNIFSHTGAGGSNAGDRMETAGYDSSGNWTWGENIAWKSFNGTVNIQAEVQQLHINLMNSPGHRANLLKGDFREIGVGVETGQFENYDAAMVTQNFARTASDSFLIGVAFNDLDSDNHYDIAEGFGNVAVSAKNDATGAIVTTTTNVGGGYDLELPNGTYTVSFSGGDFTTTALQTNINNKNVKLDLINPDNSGTPTLPPVPEPNTISGTLSSDSLDGTSGDDEIFGHGGNDMLHGGAGNDAMDGGEGIDTAHYTGLYANYSINKTGNNFTVTANNGTEGSDVVINMERLQFADTQLALDLDGHAGTTGKILGAVFGVASVSNKEFVGIGLQLLDDGIVYQDLVQLALNAKLGMGFSDADEVNLLYENLVGVMPDTGTLNFWTGRLKNGEFTQNSLAVMAIELDLNASNIDLVGLSQTGIEFL
jgi:serralysin